MIILHTKIEKIVKYVFLFHIILLSISFSKKLNLIIHRIYCTNKYKISNIENIIKI